MHLLSFNSGHSKQNILKYFEIIYTEYLEGYQKQSVAEHSQLHMQLQQVSVDA